MTEHKLVSPRQQADNLRALLVQHKNQIAMALPRHLSADRMLRVALTAAQRNPKLLDCTPVSFFGAIVQASQLGLEPDGVLGFAYLIPFRNSKKNVHEVQFMCGYRGLLDLARRSGGLTSVEARIVHEKDQFSYAFGLTPELRHKPTREPEKGPVTHAYAIARLRDGGPFPQFDVMDRAEIEAIRSKSRAANDTAWTDYFEEMSKKTVLRRLCKLLPVSVELQRAVSLDEMVDAGVPQELDVLATVEDEPVPAPPSSLDALAAKVKADTEATLA
jgi:recombination protein RecT